MKEKLQFEIDIRKGDDAARTLSVRGGANGDFAFMLKGNHIDAVPIPLKMPELFNEDEHFSPKEKDWYKAFNDAERIRIMQALLATYRVISSTNDVTVAAIGVVENPDQYVDEEKRHLLYVGRNTNIGAEDVYKSCAEQNMVRAAEGSFENYSHFNAYPRPSKPYLKEVHVMGGSLPHHGKSGLSSVCPCGMCTDILAKKMIPGAPLYIYPHTDKIRSYPLDTASLNFSDVAAGNIWKTPIENINRNRTIKLDEETQLMQENAISWLAKRMIHELDAENTGYTPALPTHEELKRHERNLMEGRSSIAKLDVATNPQSRFIQWSKVNEYMRDQIVESLKDRALRDKVPLTYKAMVTWLKEKVVTVRCTVIQTDDGCYYVGHDSQTGPDNAYVTPEFTALGAAVPKLGTQGIKNLWYGEFNPAAILRGELPTPSKDGLERLMKRMSKTTGDIAVTVIPFNELDQNTNKKLKEEIEKYTFSIKDLVPGGFMGTKAQEQNGSGHGGGGDDLSPQGKRFRSGEARYKSHSERILLHPSATKNLDL